MKFNDLTGKIFGRWTVLKGLGVNKNKQHEWLCRCECGNEKRVLGCSLTQGRSKSCGCLSSELKSQRSGTHRKSSESIYHTYNGMIDRCHNPNNQCYDRYDGRGIEVCDRWRDSFENFYADMGDKPTKKHTIDRIDNDGNYSPENCRWATMTQQAANRGLGIKNKTGIKGVNKNRKGEYHAQIQCKGKKYHLGFFNDFFEACCARRSAEIKFLAGE